MSETLALAVTAGLLIFFAVDFSFALWLTLGERPRLILAWNVLNAGPVASILGCIALALGATGLGYAVIHPAVHGLLKMTWEVFSASN